MLGCETVEDDTKIMLNKLISGDNIDLSMISMNYCHHH